MVNLAMFSEKKTNLIMLIFCNLYFRLIQKEMHYWKKQLKPIKVTSGTKSEIKQSPLLDSTRSIANSRRLNALALIHHVEN